MKTRSKAIVSALVAALTISLLSVKPSLAAADDLQFKPLRLGLLPDFTQSMPENDQPQFSMEQLLLAIQAIKRRGGELALGTITEKSKKALARLTIEPVMGRLDERAFVNGRNKSGEAKFIADVRPRIERKADAKDTDVLGALQRFSFYFDEPADASVEKRLIVFSDGTDSKQRPKKILPADVRVIAIGMDRPVAQGWFGKNVTVVESFKTAVDQLRVKN